MALLKNSYGIVDLQATCAKQQEEIDALMARVALEGGASYVRVTEGSCDASSAEAEPSSESNSASASEPTSDTTSASDVPASI